MSVYKIAIPAVFVLIILAFLVVTFGFTDSAEARYLENEHFCMTDSDCHFVPGCCAEPKATNIYHEYESSILCKAVCPDAAFSIPQDKAARCIENQCVAVDV